MKINSFCSLSCAHINACGYDVIFLSYIHLVMCFYDIWIYALLLVSNTYVAFFQCVVIYILTYTTFCFTQKQETLTYFLCIKSIVDIFYSL